MMSRKFCRSMQTFCGALVVAFASNALADAPAVAPPGAAPITDEAAAILREVEAEVDATTASEPGGDLKFLIYGFLDSGLHRYFHPDAATKSLLDSQRATFVSGNTNIYLDVRPVSGWRALIETRLSRLPHGDYNFSTLGTVPRRDSNVIDATSPSARNNVQLGSVVIERSQIEWTRDDAVNLRVGYFFTPWGIWNVDHGTPTLISLLMPSFLVQETIPQRQTGVEFYGRWNGPPWQLDYHLYVTNGRTVTLFDLSDGKAVGGRLVLRHSGRARFAIGLSGLYSDTQDETKSISLGSDGYPLITSKTISRYSEQSVGADLSLDVGGFRFRAEVVRRSQIFDKGFRPPSVFRPGSYVPNAVGNFAYAIAAYRFARHFEPYFYAEYGDGGQRNNIVDAGHALSVGLNIYFTPYTQLKTQYSETNFSNFSGNDHKLGFFTSRLVLAF